MLDFQIPRELEAGEPPEARGLARDQVRLMVSYRADNHIIHARFRDLPNFLEPGDLLVINTSGTMNAALDAIRADGAKLELHLSTHLPADLWVVELREPNGSSTKPFWEAQAGETLRLPGGAAATLHEPYPFDGIEIADPAIPFASSRGGSPGALDSVNARDDAKPSGRENIPKRLWIAALRLPNPSNDYLAQYGFPIRYEYVKQRWPLSYYQTVYATEVGSAEMPSAGRAFTPELITRLIARGVQIAPLLLHTGVASLEEFEPLYEEFYRVPAETARAVNVAHDAGKKVVAVGTTVVRALETVTDTEGITHPGEGWTRLVVTPQRGIRAIDAMLTGLHEPRAKHLAMLEALAGIEHLKIAYAEALRERYLWHEFGDLHLIMP